MATVVAAIGLGVWGLLGVSARGELRGIARVVAAAGPLGAGIRPWVDRDELPPPLQQGQRVHGEKILRWDLPEGLVEIGERHWRGDRTSGRDLYLAVRPLDTRHLTSARDSGAGLRQARAAVHGDRLVVTVRHRGVLDAGRVGALLTVADEALGLPH